MQRRLGLDLEIPDDFGHWLAGFTDGEASFVVTIHNRPDGRRNLRMPFQITLRADDEAVLRKIKDTLGIGRLFRLKASPGDLSPHPSVRYNVKRIADLYHIIVPLFEKYPLQSKKANDFALWKEIVAIKYHEGRPQGPTRLPQSFWDKVMPLVKQLKQARKFSP